MRGLFSRQKQGRKCSKLYIIIRFLWVQKMNRLVQGLTKSQLWFSLIVFTILGTCLCFYMALKGFLIFSHDRIQIHEMTSIRPAYKNYNIGPLHLDISRKNDEQQSSLSKYIDSVLDISSSIDLLPIEHSKGKEKWDITIFEENKTANDKK